MRQWQRVNGPYIHRERYAHCTAGLSILVSWHGCEFQIPHPCMLLAKKVSSALHNWCCHSCVCNVFVRSWWFKCGQKSAKCMCLLPQGRCSYHSFNVSKFGNTSSSQVCNKRRMHMGGAFCSSWDMNSMYDHLIKCLCHSRWRLDINSSQPRDCVAQRKKLFMEPPVILLNQIPTSRRALSLTWSCLHQYCNLGKAVDSRLCAQSW